MTLSEKPLGNLNWETECQFLGRVILLLFVSELGFHLVALAGLELTKIHLALSLERSDHSI